MSISQVKVLAWIGAAGLFGYMFLFAWNFAIGVPEPLYEYAWFLDPDGTQAKLNQGPSRELQEEVLGGVQAPPPEKDDLVDYASVQNSIVDLDWTGKPPPMVVKPAEDAQELAGPPATPVSDLLRVIFIRYDSSSQEDSLAFVKYLAPELAAAPPGASQLYPGDALPAPYGHVKVEEIRPGVVVFSFDDEAREHELLEPAEYGEEESYITLVGEGAEPVLPPSEPLISQGTVSVYRPKQTTAIGTNRYRIGTEDSELFGQKWTEILSREVRLRRHRDPVTGKYDGIEVSSIAPGSVAGRFGAQSGDIIKSINGHPVTSKTEAISFVKHNDDVYDRWEAVVERLGRDVTIVIEEPPAE